MFGLRLDRFTRRGSTTSTDSVVQQEPVQKHKNNNDKEPYPCEADLKQTARRAFLEASKNQYYPDSEGHREIVLLFLVRSGLPFKEH